MRRGGSTPPFTRPPYGELTVDIQTSRLLGTISRERGGLMEIQYSIAVEHTVTGRNCFKIRVRRKIPRLISTKRKRY